MDNTLQHKITNRKTSRVFKALGEEWYRINKLNRGKIRKILGIFVFINLTIIHNAYASSMGEARANFMYGMIPIYESYSPQLKTYIISQNQETHQNRIKDAEKFEYFCSKMADCFSSFCCCISTIETEQEK